MKCPHKNGFYFEERNYIYVSKCCTNCNATIDWLEYPAFKDEGYETGKQYEGSAL